MPKHSKLTTLTLAEKFRIYEMMKPYITVVEPNEDVRKQIVRYVDGHNDNTMAEKAGGVTKPNHILTIRRDMYGALYVQGSGKRSLSDTKKQLDEVRAAVFDLVNKLVATEHLTEEDANEILDGIVG